MQEREQGEGEDRSLTIPIKCYVARPKAGRMKRNSEPVKFVILVSALSTSLLFQHIIQNKGLQANLGGVQIQGLILRQITSDV